MRQNRTELLLREPNLYRAFLIPVSYTHLDVYKRQVMYLLMGGEEAQ